MTSKSTKTSKSTIDIYTHQDKTRLNTPPSGLVSTTTDKPNGTTTYQHDPHIDPYLSWSGKREEDEFDVYNTSLHLHEKINPATIISYFLKNKTDYEQLSLFEQDKLPPDQEIEFYQHPQNWTNRLIAGDSLLVMHSLLYKESMENKVQMVYLDPPYGIKYSSNFQPFTHQRDVKESDEYLSHEPEVIKAFRDIWELGIHSYLSYLRNRLLLARELLHPSGSVFVQISDENVHLIRIIMDEIFGKENFVALIPFRTKNRPMGAKYLEQMCDFLVWYAKGKKQLKYRQLYLDKETQGNSIWKYIGFSDGRYRKLTQEEVSNYTLLKEDFEKGADVFRSGNLEAVGKDESRTYTVEFEGQQYKPTGSWKYDKQVIQRLIEKKLVFVEGNFLRGKYFLKDYPVQALTIPWLDTNLGNIKTYVVQTAVKVLERCILMTTDPGDLVFDPTCGSGTTAYVAEMWGRRWITCDTSRIALTLTKQRLMTATYAYYQLKYPEQGISSGFQYKTVPHVTLKSLAQNLPPEQETLYDQPVIKASKCRVTGPFTVEAVPSLRVIPLNGREPSIQDTNRGLSQSGPTAQQQTYLHELKNSGVRTRENQVITFSKVEPTQASSFLHAYAEIGHNEHTQYAYISIGPDYAPLEIRQAQLAVEEAQALKHKPDYLILSAFHFDPEAVKYIHTLEWPGVQVLQVSMNTDLLTQDLRKGSKSSQSFWLVGQPDIHITKHNNETYQVCVKGFDYYDPSSGKVESYNTHNIAMWFLDTNYDGHCLFPHQVFFVMPDGKNDWTKLKKTLKSIIDDTQLSTFTGTQSLPFSKGVHQQIAVKIIDNRGIESFVIRDIDE